MLYASRFQTKQGPGLVMATGSGVCRVDLPADPDIAEDRAVAVDLASSPLTVRVAALLESYFRGEAQSFRDVPVDLAGQSPFRSRVQLLIRGIPYGETRSYGEVAVMAGIFRAARAIGGAMASNPVPVIIPCHRVIAADGRLTGFSGPGGLKCKKNLLQTEGVEFKGEQVVLKKDGL